MRYSVRERNVCMVLYIEGKSAQEIQMITNIPADTIYEWSSKYNWKQKALAVEEKVTEKAIDDIAEFRTQFIQELETQIETLKSDIKLSKNPTSDKLYHVLLKSQEMLLALKGIQLTQSKTTVEHTGRIGIKLEDLV